jgi:hypothetical protein
MRYELLLELREAGITLVECDYSGYGDDGQINEIVFEPRDADFDTDQLEDFFWEITQDNYGGFHNNDGGSGSIVWNIVDNKMTIYHSVNEMISTDEDPLVIHPEDEEIGA